MQMLNAFTVDLEDWFQGLTSTNPRTERWATYEARLTPSAERLLVLLEEYRVRATFFVLGQVAELYPNLIRRIDAAGHEIGVHGYWHRMVHRLTPERFAAELDRAVEVLKPLVRQPILGHRAPYFSINRQSLWALDVLRDRGFCYDSSFFPTRNMLYGYPGAPRFPCRLGEGHDGTTGECGPRSEGLMEFPLSTARWMGITWPIGGGFYVRALPYSILRCGIRQLHRQGWPAILYVHPWELDTEQVYRQVTLRERITHYHGRRGLTKKLGRLFEEFAFCPLRDLLDLEGPSPRDSRSLSREDSG